MSVGERERVAVREQGHTEGTAPRRRVDQRLPGGRAQLRERAGVPGSRGANCAICARRTVDGLALGQVLVVRAGQYAGAVAAEEALQVAVVDVAKEHRFVCVGVG